MEDVNTYMFLSELEKKVWNWLSSHDIPFTSQERMFGYAGELGSATVDFILHERNLVLRCMGEFWHSGLEAQARDAFGKEQLINRGYQVVDLWEENLTDENIDRTMELALEGVEIPR